MSQDVSVKVGADNSALNTGLAQAKHAVDGFKEHAEESFKELGGELLAAFALTAVIEGVKELFEQFSHVQDLADKLGVSAESVQKLGVVAKSAGLDTDALVKTLQKGTKNAVEAVAGNEELSQAFEKLGVDAKEFVNLSPEEQLLALSEGFEHSGENAESLTAIMKALGKTGADVIPILRKGPEALREEMDAAHVASNEAVEAIKENTEKFEKLWGNFKAYGAEALSAITKRVEALGTGIAAIGAFLGNLTHGLEAAKTAFGEVLDAAAELQVEEDRKHEEEAKKRKPVDVDALENAKRDAEAKLKMEEELAKLKEQNAKKEEDARFRNLELLEKQVDLEQRIAELKDKTPANELEAEQNKGKLLDYQKELESVNKEVSREKEREEKKLSDTLAKADKERAKEELKTKKDALKAAEKDVSRLEHHDSVTVDSLRQIGGGIAGVNYNFNAAKDDMQKQQLDYARQQVEKLQQIVSALEAKDSTVPTYDGAFS